MYEGDFGEIRAAAAAWVPPAPDQTFYITPTVTEALDGVAYIRMRSEDFTLQFNWMRNTNMAGFIASLKSAVPYDSRAFDPVTKLWRFKKEHLDTVKGVITNSHIFTETREISSEDITPPNSYTFSSGRSGYGYRRYV